MSVDDGTRAVQDHEPRHEVSVRLPNEPQAVKVARDQVAAALLATGWPDHTIDMALVITSELVTNAVIHARTPFELNVLVAGHATISVEDGDVEGAPALAEKGGNRPGGLGLHLVETMASDWGVERTPSGKVVWARLEMERLD